MSTLQHLLIFEPRLGGHHLTWLRYVTDDFLAVGIKVTLAVDLRLSSEGIVGEKFGDLASEIKLISAYSKKGSYKGGSKTASLCLCLKESGAQEVFMTNFDEIASVTLRRAALGLMPPKALKGKISGIYFRPRFMGSYCWPLGNIFKYVGFSRLSRGGWLKNIYLLDEFLIDRAANNWGDCNFHFLPDAWSGDYSHDKILARKKLGVPEDKFVYLNYGIGTRRKGLHLVLKAMLGTKLPKRVFLLCAGKIADDRELLEGAAELEKREVAKVINRYVSDEEEELSFAACDAVLLPYVKHFGSSGVLSRAAAAGKMVVASDEGLVGRRVREHNLGLLFKSGDVGSLQDAMMNGLHVFEEREGEKSVKYAETCSRSVFRQVLSKPFLNMDKKSGAVC